MNITLQFIHLQAEMQEKNLWVVNLKNALHFKNRFWVLRSRVSLDSIVYAFLSGNSAETIAQAFPVLTLEQVYGAIASYLANRDEIDAYLNAAPRDFAAKRQAARDADPMFYQKLAEAKRQLKKVKAF